MDSLHRWIWLSFHVAVWVSIAYAAGIAVEQHHDWLNHEAIIGRRRQMREAAFSMMWILGQVVAWIQKYRVGDAKARKLAAALSLLFLLYMVSLYGSEGSVPERALKPEELWLLGYIVASHLAFAVMGPPAEERRPEQDSNLRPSP